MSPQIYNNIVLFIHLFNSKPKKSCAKKKKITIFGKNEFG